MTDWTGGCGDFISLLRTYSKRVAKGGMVSMWQERVEAIIDSWVSERKLHNEELATCAVRILELERLLSATQTLVLETRAERDDFKADFQRLRAKLSQQSLHISKTCGTDGSWVVALLCNILDDFPAEGSSKKERKVHPLEKYDFNGVFLGPERGLKDPP